VGDGCAVDPVEVVAELTSGVGETYVDDGHELIGMEAIANPPDEASRLIAAVARPHSRLGSTQSHSST
jgi:hypothetical protein